MTYALQITQSWPTGKGLREPQLSIQKLKVAKVGVEKGMEQEEECIVSEVAHESDG